MKKARSLVITLLLMVAFVMAVPVTSSAARIYVTTTTVNLRRGASTNTARVLELPKEAERYTLAGQDGNMRATIMTLNDKPLVLGEDNALPDLSPVVQPAGQVELAPGTCTFFVL